eukprot:2679481-Prymnesium_polylepis.1
MICSIVALPGASLSTRSASMTASIDSVGQVTRAGASRPDSARRARRARAAFRMTEAASCSDKGELAPLPDRQFEKELPIEPAAQRPVSVDARRAMPVAHQRPGHR